MIWRIVYPGKHSMFRSQYSRKRRKRGHKCIRKPKYGYVFVCMFIPVCLSLWKHYFDRENSNNMSIVQRPFGVKALW